MFSVVDPSFQRILDHPVPVVKVESNVGQTVISGPQSNVGFKLTVTTIVSLPLPPIASETSTE
jgi:hypothetical protein